MIKKVGVILGLLTVLKCQAVKPILKVYPGVSVGYAFGRGIMGCVDLAMAVAQYKLASVGSVAGVHASYTVFTNKMELYSDGYFRAISANVFTVVNEQYIVRVGIASTKLKWGMNNVNTTTSKGWGPNVDLGYTPVINLPYLGFRYYYNHNGCLGLKVNNPHFLYVGYQRGFDVIKDKH